MDVAEYYNKAIVKSARNPLISLLPASLLPTSLPPASSPPAFEPLISSSPTTSKTFNCYHVFVSFKRQADRIAVQNVQYKIAFKLYILTILF